MIHIKTTDLEILYKEKEEKETATQSTVKSLANLLIENKKKYILLDQLSKIIVEMNIEIQNLKEVK